MNKLIVLAVSVILFAGCVQVKSNKDINKELFTAAKQGQLENVKNLLGKGANVNFVCEDSSCKGWTPVMIAAAENHADVVKFLLENDADPNAQNQYGRTALHFAVNYSLEPIVNLLLEYKADPTIRTYQNQGKEEPATPTEAAMRRMESSLGNRAAYNILKTLVYKTKEVNVEFAHSTPLMVAVIANDYDFTKFLLDNGANPYHVLPKQDANGNVKEYYEVDELVLAGGPVSEKLRALFVPYNQKKKQEQALVKKEGIVNIQKLQKIIDDDLNKNGKLSTDGNILDKVTVSIKDGKKNDYHQIVTPNFIYGLMCDNFGCAVSADRFDNNNKEIYRLSIIKTTNQIDTWKAICTPKNNLGIAGCVTYSQYLKILEINPIQ